MIIMARFRLLRTDAGGVVVGAAVFDGENSILVRKDGETLPVMEMAVGMALLGAGQGNAALEARVEALEQAVEGIPVPG